MDGEARPPAAHAPPADLTEVFAETVRAASEDGRALEIIGGGTKRFYGRSVAGEPLHVAGHCGVIDYEPSELVITARGGTPLAEIEARLAQHGQMLAFEPLDFGPASTLGGVIAAGLAGPRRPFAGAVRDSILGVTVLDGRGRPNRLGGTVFKNVAGFDGFRLQAGALGCLGVLLDISLRVAPRPASEVTVALEESWPTAAGRLAALLRRPTPLSGAMHDGYRLWLRLSGPAGAVEKAATGLGGERSEGEVWSRLRRFELPVLEAPRLWRLSIPRAALLRDLPGEVLRDWAGAQVWLASDAPAEHVRGLAHEAGGHAALVRGAQAGEPVFESLPEPLLALHQRVKAAFDPAGVFNPGRMYESL
ncbi:MAG TPA: glycolate oxidase subunit GlcE [Caulobacteraceae bacterium]|jgi:glycolate oxidase FAD binding subunit